jgi:glycerol kinase
MSVVISIDAGTTGVRSFVVDEDGTPVGLAYREVTQHYPQPGWVEHDASEIWDCVQATLAEVTDGLEQPVAALGITDQRETVVVWDRRTGEPLHRAIVWQDRRTADRCRELEGAGHLPLVRRTAGLVLDPYFSASKLSWLLTEGGVTADEHLAFGTVDSWLLWKLTGGQVHATEPSNASRTLLFDIRTVAWSPELLDLFGVPASCLPEVLPTSGRFGTTTDDAACGAGIPISGIAGDQQAALFGQMCVRPGMAKNTYGTGAFTLANVGTEAPEPVDGLLSTVAWTVPASVLGAGGAGAAGSTGAGGLVTHYALEGAIYVAGAAVQWLRDGLEIIDEAPAVEALARECDDTEGVFLVPAFTGLGSPWWDPYARGTVVGITRGTGRAQIARATLESIAFQTRDVIDAMAAAGGHPIEELRVDGGAAADQLLLQLQADQLGIPVVRPAAPETTALGAAYLAGLAEGVWDSVDDIEHRWQVDLRTEPAMAKDEADARHQQWLRAVERSRGWADDR